MSNKINIAILALALFAMSCAQDNSRINSQSSGYKNSSTEKHLVRNTRELHDYLRRCKKCGYRIFRTLDTGSYNIHDFYAEGANKEISTNAVLFDGNTSNGVPNLPEGFIADEITDDFFRDFSK